MIYFDLCLSSITCLNALSLEVSPIQSNFEMVVPQWPNEVHAKGIFLNILKKYQLSSQSWDSSSYNSSVFCPPAMLLQLPFPSTDNTPNWWKKLPRVIDDKNICGLWAYKHYKKHNRPRHCLNFSFIITQMYLQQTESVQVNIRSLQLWQILCKVGLQKIPRLIN